MEIKPGYKQTEVGVIPVSWTIAELQKVCREQITYGIVQCGPHVENGVPYIRVSDMNTPELDVSGMLRTSPAIAAKFSRSRVEEGDIVYALRGKIGEVRRVGPTVAGANLTQGTARLSPNNSVRSAYLLWALRSQRSLRQAEFGAKGSTFREITLADLRQIHLPIPSPVEQEAIAEALGDADALIESLEQLIAKKRQIKQGAMQELLTGKRRLPGFSGAWEKKTFGEIFNYHSTATNARSDLSPEGNTYYIHYGDVHMRFHSHLDFSREEPPRIDRQRCKNATLIQNGDWIMADASEDFSGVGKSVEVCGLAEGIAAVSGLHTFLLREKKPTFAPGFKGHLGNLHSLHQQFLRVMTGMKVFGVSKTALRNLLLPVPDPKEQTAIAAVLSDMDAEIAVLEAKLDKTCQLKQGMMQELLTGKTRLV